MAALLATVAEPALAGDGVLEINQACVTLPGGCFAGDSSGFPVTLSQSGSYILTSDLQLPDTNTSGIQITADRVSLDMRGFGIRAPGTCVLTCPVSSCTGGLGKGIYTLGAGGRTIAIKNGEIRGMGSHGGMCQRE
jgi:hypothetical protein